MSKTKLTPHRFKKIVSEMIREEKKVVGNIRERIKEDTDPRIANIMEIFCKKSEKTIEEFEKLKKEINK